MDSIRSGFFIVGGTVLIVLIILFLLYIESRCTHCRGLLKRGICTECGRSAPSLKYSVYSRDMYYSLLHSVTQFYPTLIKLDPEMAISALQEELESALNSIPAGERRLISGLRGYIEASDFSVLRNFCRTGGRGDELG